MLKALSAFWNLSILAIQGLESLVKAANILAREAEMMAQGVAQENAIEREKALAELKKLG